MRKPILLFTFISIFAMVGFGQKTDYGTIQGKLVYPSEYIPPAMIVCVQQINTGDETFCSDSKNKGYSFKLDHAKAKYSVTLPVGEYFVFSAFPFGKAGGNTFEGYMAYYNEFVTCGYDVKCESHKNIVVKVEANKTTSNIDPGDWYKKTESSFTN